MRILGIDPGTRTMGWGMIDVRSGNEILGPCGHIQPKESDIAQRLGQIHHQLSHVVVTHRPDVMVLESIFIKINPASALTLGYARGIALAVAGCYGVSVVEYSPTAIKKSLTGYGHATKDQMIAMIIHLFSVQFPADTADALAGALCHARHLPFLELS